MKQIVIIHGGDSFTTHHEYLNSLKSTAIDYERLKPRKRWTDTIVREVPDADVLTPRMPCSENARFEEWVIWFEKIIPFFKDDVRLVGHSLGAMFLAKYLQNSPLDHPVTQLHLIAAGYDDAASGYGDFAVSSATNLMRSARSVHIYHSEDDFVVPYHELDKFIIDMPEATVHRFADRNHFLDSEFPELIELLQR